MSKPFLATEPQKSKIILDVLEQVGQKKKWKRVKLTELQRRAAAKQCSALAFVTERERRTVTALSIVQNKFLRKEIAVFLQPHDLRKSLIAQ